MPKNKKLMSAAEHGDLKTVKLLVTNGVDINYQNFKLFSSTGISGTDVWPDRNSTPKGNTALMKAAKNGHLDIVKFLVANGADINLIGETALDRATENKHTEIANYLKLNSLKASNREKGKQLMLAAEHGDLETVKELLANRADVNYIKCDIFSYTYVIENRSSSEEKKSNTEIGKCNIPLMKAAKNGHLDIVKFLVANGADINHQNKNGSTAFIACY